MKKFKHIMIPLAFMIVYIASGVLIQRFVPDSVTSTLLANVFLILIGFFYYNTSIGDACLPVSRWAVPITGVLLIPFWFCVSVTSTALVALGADLGSYASMTPEQSALYALMSVLIAPIAEEILFRGILFRHLKSIWSAPVACVVSSIIFGAFHGTWTHVYLGFFCGVFFCIIYEYTGRLGACIAVHAGYNLLTALLSGVSIPSVFMEPVVLLLGNLAMLISLIFAGVIIEERIARRVGQVPKQREPKMSVARFLRRVVPGYAGPVDLTVRHVCQCFMPGIGVQILDMNGTQLFLGVVSDMEQPANASVFNRKLIGKQSWTTAETIENRTLVYLVFRVL